MSPSIASYRNFNEGMCVRQAREGSIETGRSPGIYRRAGKRGRDVLCPTHGARTSDFLGWFNFRENLILVSNQFRKGVFEENTRVYT